MNFFFVLAYAALSPFFQGLPAACLESAGFADTEPVVSARSPATVDATLCAVADEDLIVFDTVPQRSTLLANVGSRRQHQFAEGINQSCHSLSEATATSLSGSFQKKIRANMVSPNETNHDETSPSMAEQQPSRKMMCNRPIRVAEPVALVKSDSYDDDESHYVDFAISNLSTQHEFSQDDDFSGIRDEVDDSRQEPAEPIEDSVQPAILPHVELAGSSATELLSVAVQRTLELNFEEPVERVAIQDPSLASVRVLSPTQLAIAGETTGTTQLTVDSGGKTQSFLVSVEPNLELLSELIASVAPLAEVEIRSLNGSIVLTGRVPDAETSALIEEVAAAAAGNALIAHLRVAGVQQTMLRVVIAEVNKEALRELGVNWATGASDWSRDFFFANNVANLNPTVFGSSGVPNVLSGQQLYSVGATSNGVGTNVTFGFPRAEMQVFLNALRQNGLARTLAEPNLVAYSGQTASFLAGGEVPIPVAQAGASSGAITIKYKEFGVRLAFTPTVLGGQVVRLHVMSELSEALPSDQLAGGLPLFTFTTRRVESTIECGNGQTFVIAGLLRENVRSTVSKIPGLGDLPVLGALFSSTSYQNSETEMIVLVTPQLVAPLDPHQVLDPPGSRMTHPTDFELFSLGQLEGTPLEPTSSSGIDSDVGSGAGSDKAFDRDDSREDGVYEYGGLLVEPSDDEAASGRLTSCERDLHGSWGYEIGDGV